MKTSDLQPGDIIREFTNFGGRTYTLKVLRVGFTHTFGNISFSSGIYQAKAYEFICNGVKYIREMKKEDVLNPDSCEVKRNEIIIN